MTQIICHSKICFKCSILKEIAMFYIHKRMKDGHLNKCIECCKKDSLQNRNLKCDNPDFIQKERERGKEKYKRLNYKEKQDKKNANKKWVNSTYKNLHKKYKINKGEEIHHWNYNELESFFILKTKYHKIIHNYTIFDDESKMFRKLDGELLDSFDKHRLFILNVLREKNVEFELKYIN